MKNARVSYNESRGEEKESSGPSDGSYAEQEAVAGATEGDRTESGGGAVGEGQGAGFVYFVETEDQKFVKIGYSTRPYRRLSQLGTLRPASYALRLIGYISGSPQMERSLHRQFSADRDRGEWFRDSVVLRQFMATLPFIQPEPEEPEPEPEPELIAIPASMKCSCLRCGHQWVKRIDGRPKACPKCHETYWDIPAGKLKRGPRPKTKPQKRR